MGKENTQPWYRDKLLHLNDTVVGSNMNHGGEVCDSNWSHFGWDSIRRYYNAKSTRFEPESLRHLV